MRLNKVICDNCGKPGHLARVCFGKKADTKKPVRAIEHHNNHDSDSDSEEVWKRLPLKISHGGGTFKFRTFPDTGSAATLIAADVARDRNIVITGKSSKKFVNVSGDEVATDGVAPVFLETSNNVKTRAEAIVSRAIRNEIIIGRKELQNLKIVPERFPEPIALLNKDRDSEFNTERSSFAKLKDELINEYSKVLTDNLPESSMEGCFMKIYLTPGEKKPFRIVTSRQTPLHWKEKAEKVVAKLLRERVITVHEEPTEWCAPGFFVVKKNGDLRLVVDFTGLNKYIRRPIHTLPSTQDIISGLDPGSKVFMKLDATQGYHQIPLDEESSKLTTFLLPSSRFRFLRAPMGLSCSSDEFCCRSDQVIEGLPGIRKLVDDILVQAPDLETLKQQVKAVLERCKLHNFTLSKKKFEIGETVKFAGQMVSSKGVRPNPDFLQGLRDFPTPKSLQELRSFLGMVNQISTYHPHVARHTGVLQMLLKKGRGLPMV